MLFVRVIQAGSFTEAANRLTHSKSQISRKIASLEQQLDSSLVLRTPRGLQLTEQGKSFYQSCLAIQTHFNQAKEALHKNHHSISGKVAITAPMSLGSLFLGPLLAKFMQTHPQISIELDLSDTAKSLTESHFDLAIRAAQSLPDSNLRAKKLLSYGYIIAASPDYLTTYGTPKHPDELREHRAITCITTSKESLQTSWPFEINHKPFQVTFNKVAQVTHMWVQKQFALNGIGLIRVPSYWVKDEIESGQLCQVLEHFASQRSNLFALYKNANFIPKRISTLIEFLAKHLPTQLLS